MLCYVMLCYVMLCYVMLCYVMLCLSLGESFLLFLLLLLEFLLHPQSFMCRNVGEKTLLLLLLLLLLSHKREKYTKLLFYCLFWSGVIYTFFDGTYIVFWSKAIVCYHQSILGSEVTNISVDCRQLVWYSGLTTINRSYST